MWTACLANWRTSFYTMHCNPCQIRNAGSFSMTFGTTVRTGKSRKNWMLRCARCITFGSVRSRKSVHTIAVTALTGATFDKIIAAQEIGPCTAIIIFFMPSPFVCVLKLYLLYPTLAHSQTAYSCSSRRSNFHRFGTIGEH